MPGEPILVTFDHFNWITLDHFAPKYKYNLGKKMRELGFLTPDCV